MILIYLYFDNLDENLSFSLKKSCLDLWRKAVKIRENIPLMHTKHSMYYKAYEKNIRRWGWGVKTIHPQGRALSSMFFAHKPFMEKSFGKKGW